MMTVINNEYYTIVCVTCITAQLLQYMIPERRLGIGNVCHAHYVLSFMNFTRETSYSSH